MMEVNYERGRVAEAAGYKVHSEPRMDEENPNALGLLTLTKGDCDGTRRWLGSSGILY